MQRFGAHGELSILCMGPLFLGPIPVKLDAVAVRITQVNRLADPLVRRPFERDASAQNPSQGICELGPRRIKDGEMIQPCRAGRRRRASLALPRVQSDVVMVTACREKRCFLSVSLRDFKAKNIAIKVECAFQVGHLQMYVANSDLRVKRARARNFPPRYQQTEGQQKCHVGQVRHSNSCSRCP